jgi:macrodomain Ter protein organizer (MatP/YcbG family)
MADDSHHPQQHDLQSDLDLLVEMANQPRADEEAIRRHLESLKSKLDRFVHERRTRSGSSAG